jgi:hypothetical protein
MEPVMKQLIAMLCALLGFAALYTVLAEVTDVVPAEHHASVLVQPAGAIGHPDS